jgi:hypothetical protein
MKLIPQVIAIVVVGFLLQLFLPWYSIAFVAFVCGYALYSESNFLGGFIGVLVLWSVKIFYTLNGAATDLADRMALIFPFKEKWIMIVVTLFIGALVGGMAALSGGYLKGKRSYRY